MTKKPIQVIAVSIAVGVFIGTIVYRCIGDTPLVERLLDGAVIIASVCGVAAVISERWKRKRGVQNWEIGLIIGIIAANVRSFLLDDVRKHRSIYQGGRVVLFACMIAGLYLVLDEYFKKSDHV